MKKLKSRQKFKKLKKESETVGGEVSSDDKETKEEERNIGEVARRPSVESRSRN